MHIFCNEVDRIDIHITSIHIAFACTESVCDLIYFLVSISAGVRCVFNTMHAYEPGPSSRDIFVLQCKYIMPKELFHEQIKRFFYV